MITLALTKGKLLGPSLEVLQAAGFDVPRPIGRSLSLSLPKMGARIIVTKDFDTPFYVEHGVADLGICGKDILLERREVSVYEIADLGFGYCRMAVAGQEEAEAEDPYRPLRIATRYPHIASDYFISKQLPFELLRVTGAVELACASGLADLVVDLVDTGRTLRENGLTVREYVFASSARLIANKASYALKSKRIEELKRKFVDACGRKGQDKII